MVQIWDQTSWAQVPPLPLTYCRTFHHSLASLNSSFFLCKLGFMIIHCFLNKPQWGITRWYRMCVQVGIISFSVHKNTTPLLNITMIINAWLEKDLKGSGRIWLWVQAQWSAKLKDVFQSARPVCCATPGDLWKPYCPDLFSVWASTSYI